MPTVAAWVLIGINLGAIVAIMLLSVRLMRPRVAFEPSRCERIVKMIESGKLVEQSPGVVTLPPEISNAALGGSVCVTNLANGRLYFFKTRENLVRLQYFSGFAYSTVRVGDLPTLDFGGTAMIKLNLLGPCEQSPMTAMNVVVVRTNSDHWLRVWGPGLLPEDDGW